jgi:hypothetical protein
MHRRLNGARSVGQIRVIRYASCAEAAWTVIVLPFVVHWIAKARPESRHYKFRQARACARNQSATVGMGVRGEDFGRRSCSALVDLTGAVRMTK